MSPTPLHQFVQCFTGANAAATERATARLALVLADPEAYQIEFAGELAERGMAGALPAQELRDVALLDALLAENLAWESDEQDTSAELAEALNDILTQQGEGLALPPGALAGRRGSGPEQLDAVQDALEALGLALVLFTLDSDVFPLGVVADAQAEAVRQQAGALGFGLTVY
ncbi:DUF6630 family protein [Hymenobacter sp. PAMC 26628]|uniref:DUF6630 family protein n=1 Tax=Hymenobacter sp. PAMC 26628 TaxID=1484118 RepID=UPI0007702F3C|nr:hypothetical protein [Hymenobacter sp. PAMC 26628]AMJ64661.1 hypothetical protein AXW84_03880 [Hymenobacter sp. PAMC 26628]